MNRSALIVLVLFSALSTVYSGDDGGPDFAVLRRPLSKVEALNLALAHNGTILQAQKDVEAATGVSIQTKAIIFPSVTHFSRYVAAQDSLIERDQFNNQAWNAEITIVQSLYAGGRLLSAVRSSRLIREQAVLAFQSVVADSLLSVSNAYDQVLRNAKQIEVRDASVTFLNEYLRETQIRNMAGAVPDFDVLRQEVEVANSVAQQVQAVGNYRVSKQVFVELLGYNLSTHVSDDLPLNLATPLDSRPYPNTLSAALTEALEKRTEIAALEKEELLRDENIIVAKAGTKPSVQAFAGYNLLSRVQSRNAGDPLYGGVIGGQISWPIFDGFLTRGRVQEAVALRGRAGEAKAETTRLVELQVRTAWSNLRTAQSVLDAQARNVERGERALELAQARYNEGAGTQIDVLDAQTALTDAHGSYVDALRDFSVARSGLVRATGSNLLVR